MSILLPPAQLPQEQPPHLNPAEEALEQSLALTVHANYRDQEWWRRTKQFCTVWDQNRRHLGFLDSYFRDFGPRWQHPDWPHFNLARRQADARGARYEDWLRAQVQRLGDQLPDQPPPPEELHGLRAVEAWEDFRRACPEDEKVGGLCAQPYTLDRFNPHDPEHAGYAQALLRDIANLAGRVFKGQPEGVARLVAQAVEEGQLPLAALDLRPDLRPQVLEALSRGAARAQAETPPSKTSTSLLI